MNNVNPKEFLAVIKKSSTKEAIEFVPVFPVITGTCCISFKAGPHPAHKENLKFLIPRDSNLTLFDWMPEELPQREDDFYGVDRSLDRARLAGTVCKLQQKLEDAVVIGHTLTEREGSSPDFCFIPKKFSNIAFVLPSKDLKIVFCDELITDIFLVSSESWIDYGSTLICVSPYRNTRLLLTEAPLSC